MTGDASLEAGDTAPALDLDTYTLGISFSKGSGRGALDATHRRLTLADLTAQVTDPPAGTCGQAQHALVVLRALRRGLQREERGGGDRGVVLSLDYDEEPAGRARLLLGGLWGVGPLRASHGSGRPRWRLILQVPPRKADAIGSGYAIPP